MRKRYIYHRNTWWWGKTITIVKSDGMAMVEIAIDRKARDYGYVRGLTVHPSMRRKGIGRELMQEVEQAARAMGLKHLYLGARKTSFVVAWYMRLGYNVCEECTEECPALMFSMMKDLREIKD